ncbi:MAG: HAD family hydrolase [Halobacteria archaeon]|nr:HAD family hydrolase [Halobacteria archaeon]
MKTRSIDTVLFDLDNTLCVYERTPKDLLNLSFERVGVDPFFTVEDYFSRFDDFVDRTSGIAELREECFASIAEERGHDPELGRAVAREFAEERDHRNVRFRPGAREALESLCHKYRTGLVTNGSPGMQRQKLDSLGILDTFEALVFAGYDTHPKPDPEPFNRALDALGSTPDRAVYVGDSIKTDVAGAKSAGLRSVWIPPIEMDQEVEPSADYTVETLHGLVPPPWE